MDRNIDLCDILSDDVKEEMAKAHRSSLLMLKEVGFMLCDHDGDVVNGYWCTGEEYCISREQIRGCPPETKPIGLFHSHLSDKPEPSISDLLFAHDIGIDYLCISGKEDSEFVVACYDLRPVQEELAKLSELVSEIRDGEENVEVIIDRIERLEDKIIHDLKNSACEFEIRVL